MTLQRKRIREATVAVIKAAATDLGDRVHENRVLPFQHKVLPAASVFTRSEELDILDEAPRSYIRRCQLVVQIIVDGNDMVDDLCDEIAGAVETALEQSERLGGEAARLLLERVEGPELDKDGSRVICGINLVWEAVYEAEVAEAATPVDDFASAHVDYETHAPRTGAEAQDVVELETVS